MNARLPVCAQRKEKKKKKEIEKEERTEGGIFLWTKAVKKNIFVYIYVSRDSSDDDIVRSDIHRFVSMDPLLLCRSRLAVIQWQPGHSARQSKHGAASIGRVVAEVDRQWSWTKCNSKPRTDRYSWNTEKVGGVNWFWLSYESPGLRRGGGLAVVRDWLEGINCEKGSRSSDFRVYF